MRIISYEVCKMKLFLIILKYFNDFWLECLRNVMKELNYSPLDWEQILLPSVYESETLTIRPSHWVDNNEKIMSLRNTVK